MLRLCSREDFDKYADFAYELATDLTKSGYPTYCDGVKTKEMFMKHSARAFEQETEEMLLFEYDGTVQGLIHYEWIPEEHYIATNSFNVNTATEQALAEFLEYVGARFKGYDLFLGFPAENTSATDYLERHGFLCIENDYNNMAFLQQLDLPENTSLIRIGKENYKSFEKLHHQIEGDMYWNSERIYDDLENWVIFVKETDGKPQGAVYYMDCNDGWFEIFGIDLDNMEYQPELFKELLTTALSDARRRGGRVMSFFCEEEGEEVAKECGFTCVGNYRCYKAHLES